MADHIETEIQILPELFCFDHFLQVLIVAAIIRTSTEMLLLPPTLSISPSCNALSSFACMA